MQRQRTIVGRREQLGLLDTARRDAADGGRFALVTGAPGSGRSTLLTAAGDAARTACAAVLQVSPPAAGDVVAGFEAVLHVVRHQYEQLDDPMLAGPLAAISALCADAAAPGRVAMLAQQTALLFGLIGRRMSVVLLADDVDGAPGLSVALAAAARNRCLVVAVARTAEGRHGRAADLVVELPALTSEAIRDLVARQLGAPPDEAVLAALTAALGPLAGHPATIVETVESLNRAGRFAAVRGRLCLRDPRIPIALPVSHELVARVRRHGPDAIRIATFAAATRFDLDDLPTIADATLTDLGSYGRALDALVGDGVLVSGNGGGIRPLCPALSARLVADTGPRAVTRLHRAYAAALFRRASATTDRSLLADHIAQAGHAIPAARSTAFALAAAADAVTDREPARAADWLSAALWHADGGRTAQDIRSRLSRLLIRTGQFTRLAQMVRAAGPFEWPADLAEAAALVWLHTGTSVPQVVARRGPAERPLLQLAERWSAGEDDPGNPDPVTGTSVFATVCRALGAGLAPDDGPPEELLVAGTAGDLGNLFRLSWGDERYAVPVDGPLGVYHRLHHSYARGDLPGVVSAAREIESLRAQAPILGRLSRLWAVEALALLGKADEAHSWLASVPDGASYAALRWWAANGPAAPVKTVSEAARLARQAMVIYVRQRAHGSRIGIEQLLTRAAAMAARFRLAAIATELAALAESDRSGLLSTETALLVRALTTGDETAASAAADLTRTRGHQPAIGLAALSLGQSSRHPRPWLLEAQAAAGRMSSPWLHYAASATMRERDVQGPRTRSADGVFNDVEVRIVELIRGAHTNRQIAAQLRLSEKTVENYLTRLFARTGCRSRVELAAASLTTDLVGAAR